MERERKAGKGRPDLQQDMGIDGQAGREAWREAGKGLKVRGERLVATLTLIYAEA